MTWKEVAIAAYEEKKQEIAEFKARQREDYLKGFKGILSQLGIEPDWTTLSQDKLNDSEDGAFAVIADGVEFWFKQIHQSYQRILVIARTCEKCGELMFSAPIITHSDLGTVLVEWVKKSHSCPRPSEATKMLTSEDKLLEALRELMEEVAVDAIANQ
jgi:hypothetical protein